VLEAPSDLEFLEIQSRHVRLPKVSRPLMGRRGKCCIGS